VTAPAPAELITVAIADDDELVRMALRVLVEREPDLHLVGEAADGHQALSLVRSRRPHVLLLDLQMPGLHGLEVLRAVTTDPALAVVRVVVVTTFEIDHYVHEALQAGASGFLLKTRVPAELVNAVRVVAAGQALLSPSVTRRGHRHDGQPRRRTDRRPAGLGHAQPHVSGRWWRGWPPAAPTARSPTNSSSAPRPSAPT